MTVRPTLQKIEKLLGKIEDLLDPQSNPNIRSAASVLGLMNDMCKGVDYGLNHVKGLEADKIKSLKKSGAAQFNGKFKLSEKGREDLAWWQGEVRTGVRSIRIRAPNLTLTTDASTSGLGAVFEESRTGGRWSQRETENHINVLELKAIELGLKTFLRDRSNVGIKIVTDNTTSVAYVNHMGGYKVGSVQCGSSRYLELV